MSFLPCFAGRCAHVLRHAAALVILGHGVSTQAAMTVTAEPVTEGSGPTGARVARFTLTQEPAVAHPTSWEYSTSADTAREGQDYLGVRGIVTLPAHQTTTVVEVPLVDDAVPEPEETFSLIVWPQAETPMPALTEIAKPSIGLDDQPSFTWPAGFTSVVDGRWCVDRVFGHTQPGSWSVRRLAARPDLGPGSIPWLVLRRDWFSVAYWAAQDSSENRYSLHSYWDGVPEALNWEPVNAVPYAGSELDYQSRVAMSGHILALLQESGVSLMRLAGANPPQPVGFLPLEPLRAGDPATLAFDGDRLVINRLYSLQVYDRVGHGYTEWALRRTLEERLEVKAFEGDRLLTLRIEDHVAHALEIRERSAGGPDQWGVRAELTYPDGTLPATARWAMRGATVFTSIADEGRVHVHAPDPVSGNWSWRGAFSVPGGRSQPGGSWPLAVAGLDLLLAAPTGDPLTDAAWGGALPGASVRVRDDDLPVLWVVNQVAEEPATGSLAVTGRVELSQPSATAVRFTLTTVDGTARAGADYTPLHAELTIPPGELAVPFTIDLLADSALEDDESFSLSVSQVTGAQAQPGEKTAWTIRDAAIRRPVVHAEGATIYEGAGPVALPVHFVETGTPLAVPWSLQPVALATTTASGIFPRYGKDLAAGQSGLLSGGPNPSTTFQVSAWRDLELDPDEYVSAVFDLEAGVEAGSFARRFVDSLDHHSFGQPVQATTDGNWVVVVEREPSSDGPGPLALGVYARDATAPGGWKKRPSLPTPTTGDGLSTYLKLRHGRLLYYDGSVARAWVFAAPATADGPWVLETAFPTTPSASLTSFICDFDGNTFVAQSGNTLLFHERGDGRWLAVHTVGALGHSTGPGGRPVLDGPRCAVAMSRVGTSPAVQILERSGPPLAPWVLRATVPHPDADAPPRPLLLGRFLAVGRSGEPETRVYERAPDGSWPLRQVIPDELLLAGRSLFFGTDAVHALTGATEAPWQPLGRSPWFRPYDTSDLLDACDNVLVRRESLTGSGELAVPGFSISEPGVEPVISDEQSFEFSFQYGHDNSEGTSDVKYAELYVFAWAPAPLPITIRYRTDPTGGSATPDVDYRPVEGVLTIPAGEKGAWVRVPVLPDANHEPAETISIQFDPPSYGAPSLGKIDLYIVDPPLGLAPPVSAALHVFEPSIGSETFVLPFSVAHPQKQDVAYQYEINRIFPSTPDAATDEDVIIASGSGTLRAGSTAVPVPLTVLADTVAEGPELIEVIVMLANQQPHRFSAEVTIGDRAPPGSLPDSYTTTQGVVLPPAPARNVRTNDPAGFSGILPGLPALAGQVEPHPDGTFRYEPAPNFIGTDRWAYRGSQGSEILLPEDASWKWLHPLDGRDPQLDQPGFQAQWMSPGFDDSQWSPGAGLMGCGTLGAEPGRRIDTHLGDPVGRSGNPTAYFRTRFQGPAAPAPGITVRFACADGVIFYLNGVPIGRHAPAPMLGFATAADTYSLVTGKGATTGPVETRPITLFFPSATVLPGPNVLAVSLHNGSPTSPDLGLQVFEIATGSPTAPVRVDVEVADTFRPPVVRDDTYAIPTTTTPLDSMFLAGGSAYTNDGLISPAGTTYDPILEVEVGGIPAGPVRFDRNSGHFTLDAPVGYFGTTSFTYRVRDKDGWSDSAVVALNVSPSRAFDVWRQAQFGGDSTTPQSDPAADGDGDGRTNLMEFALGSSPAAADTNPALELTRSDGAWVVDFIAATGFGRDVFIGLEQAPSLAANGWQRVAWLNDSFPHLEVLAPDVTQSKVPGPNGLTRYRITLPPTADHSSFLRLRVSRPAHPMVP